MRQPKLIATNRELAELYYTKTYVTAKDLKEIFGVGITTAGRALDYCKEYAESKGKGFYPIPGVKRVYTELLFEAYHWDIKQISRKVKEGAKIIC